MTAFRPFRAHFLPLSVALVLFVPARNADAQYMYLDANGDGVHTSADVMASSGTTTVGVWLRTNVNRDGSAATCVTSDGALSMNSYEFILRASNGTVSWGAPVNQIAEFTIPYGNEFSGADYHAGFVSGTSLPPGDYHLATVAVTVTGGTPAIGIATSTPLNPSYLTSFGAQCSGNDFDNTMKLGSEWIDTDGLDWGGTANRPPALAQPSDMSVVEGQTADQILSATDPDGDPVTFTGSPLRFLTVTTTSPGTGTASGLVHLAPGASDGGTYVAEIQASDGFATNRRSFHITVIEGLSIDAGPVADMTVGAYSFASQNITARDLDNRPLEFVKSAGPDFMTVLDRNNGTAEIRLDSGLDAGVYPASVTIRDGVSPDVVRNFQITVTPPPPCAPGYCYAMRDWTPERPGFEVHLADVNGDSHLDIITPEAPLVTVRLGTGNGAFGFPIVSPFPGPPQIDLYGTATADLNRDGRADLLLNVRGINDFNHAQLIPLYGQADGTMISGAPIFTGPLRGKAAFGDFNGDGIPDVASASDFTSEILVAFGMPGGGYSPPATITAPLPTNAVEAADVNGDGITDVVAGIGYSDQGSIAVFPGHADGTFGPIRVTPLGFPFGTRSILTGDWNADGRPDVAVNLDSGPPGLEEVLLGKGDGTFTTPQSLSRHGIQGERIVTGDVDGDGALDVILGGHDPISVSGAVSILFGKGDGTFRAREDVPRLGFVLVDVASGDVNEDGKTDLAVADTRTVRVLLSRGFSPQPNRPPLIYGVPDSIRVDNQSPYPYVFLQPRMYDPDDDPFVSFSVDQSALPGPVFNYGSLYNIPGWYYSLYRISEFYPPGTYPMRFTGKMGADTVVRDATLVVTGKVPETFAANVVFADSRPLPLVTSGPQRPLCVGIESADSRYSVWEINLSTIVMKSDLGSVGSIHAITDKGTVVGDLDHNGVYDLQACFSRGDLAKLFSLVRGRRQVTAAVQCYLYSGRPIAGTATFTVVGTGGAGDANASAFVSPNPLNPEGLLVFETADAGAARVDLYDVRGRRVRTLVHEDALAAGRHEVRIDGRDGRGDPLASGIYYYRVTTSRGESSGRFAILK